MTRSRPRVVASKAQLGVGNREAPRAPMVMARTATRAVSRERAGDLGPPATVSSVNPVSWSWTHQMGCSSITVSD
jgi:hypothetical protein